jgi:tRNA 5-methylaminomethyl-2-thiouridine biosynthesis bifunctional protein
VGVGATTIVDTAFGAGEGLLRAWQALSADPSKPGRLHYVALLESGHWPIGNAPYATSAAAQDLAQALGALCVAGPPKQGFYRLPFDGARVLLTLCIGPRAASLAQLALTADQLMLDANAVWTRGELHSLHALARRGTTLHWAKPNSDLADSAPLDASRWKPVRPGTWVFDPAWTVRNSRRAAGRFAQAGHCTVIGAGISGALVARALALRGWQVTVLEQGPQPAAGASGLPTALVSVSGNSAADPLFGLTRSAYHLTRRMLQTMLVQGVDWDEGGALSPEHHGRRQPGHVTPVPSADEAQNHAPTRVPLPWQPEALWVKPQPWIRACLSTPGVTLRCGARVHSLRYETAQWAALNDTGQAWASGDLLLLCNALDARRLLGASDDRAPMVGGLSPAMQQALSRLQALYGSISSGPASVQADWPALPIHGQGHGHFLPAVPAQAGFQWLAGAGFAPDDSASVDTCHRANLARAAPLVPALAGRLQAQYEAGQLGLWRGQRCVSHDRLPLLGPAGVGGGNGLWVCLAMGARGLTFAALCAELVASRLMAEPLPLPKSLARLLDAQRLQNRATHKAESTHYT